ncbi:Rab GTPase 2d [Yasminevirus sp. GU-2018]|uniref:Rab GTPase 2d (Macronuclear) n=1 Tax=Yasminevirus sp. GU-2018 TaxID=2420051 RepID=A0A5K0U9R7_9VIRU|nr:Rab GTPase 2d [Yasminevirus sp. GU-2018]
MSKPIYDYILKFIIVGNSTVGKSNIMTRFTDKRFRSTHDMTIGVEFATKIVSNNNVNYKIQIWDTAGQETFQAITRSYYRGTIGCLMVYDVTNRASFEAIAGWLKDLRSYCDPQIVITLVGNKIDLETSRQVSYEEGKEFADKNGLNFFETSAKTGQNIESCFLNIVQQISKKIETKEIDILSSKGCTHASTIKLAPAPASSGSWGCYC